MVSVPGDDDVDVGTDGLVGSFKRFIRVGDLEALIFLQFLEIATQHFGLSLPFEEVGDRAPQPEKFFGRLLAVAGGGLSTRCVRCSRVVGRHLVVQFLAAEF